HASIAAAIGMVVRVVLQPFLNSVEPIPGSLRVCQLHRPHYCRARRVASDLCDRLVILIKAVDTESGRLTLNTIFTVLVAVFRFGPTTGCFRSDEELVWAVANAGDSNSRVNFAVTVFGFG